jgi:hypothetical protein
VLQVVKVVLVDVDSGQVMDGGIWRNRHYLPDPPPAIPREELEKQLLWKYSTVNLLEFFPLPRRRARYHVHAMLEAHCFERHHDRDDALARRSVARCVVARQSQSFDTDVR